MSDAWLTWARRVRAIAQTGAAYTKDAYDADRYAELGRIAEDMLAALGDVPPAVIRALFAGESGYPTPKVDVRAGVFENGEILLVRERSDGRWALPGGWADEHLSPSASVAGEVREESGYEVDVERLVAVKDRHMHRYTPRGVTRIYKLFFLCRLTGGQATSSLETAGAEFFALDALPPLSPGRVLREDIVLLDAHRRDPALAVYFD